MIFLNFSFFLRIFLATLIPILSLDAVDLDKLPILKHNERDGGRYISSAVVVTKDPEFGQNLDFHRAMQFAKNRMSTRIIKGRDFYKFLERSGEVEAAYCVGNTPHL